MALLLIVEDDVFALVYVHCQVEVLGPLFRDANQVLEVLFLVCQKYEVVRVEQRVYLDSVEANALLSPGSFK